MRNGILALLAFILPGCSSFRMEIRCESIRCGYGAIQGLEIKLAATRESE